MLGTSQSYICSPLILKETYLTFEIASNSGKYHIFFFAALPAVNRSHVVLQLEVSKALFQLLNLPLIGRDESELILIVSHLIGEEVDDLYYSLGLFFVRVGGAVPLLFCLTVNKEHRVFLVKEPVLILNFVAASNHLIVEENVWDIQ